MAKKYQLKNGMSVLLIESHKSPVVSVQMWVKTGSADETKGIEGISHFIEHLVFKGTDKFKVGEVAGTVEGAGGQLNAYTSFDETVFYVTLSKDFTETGLDVISQLMGHPTFEENEIDNEREVVIEEIKRSNDNPHRQASSLLFTGSYKKHPYRVPVLGYEDNIRTVTRDQIVDYYQSRYVPENMTLVVTGDFESKEIKKSIRTYFESFEAFKLKKIKRVKEPERKRARLQVMEQPFEQTIIHMSWPVPKVTHKDIAALDVLAFILGSGDSSRLIQALRIEQPLTHYASASIFTHKDPGFFALSLYLNGDKVVPALERLNEELLKILEEVPLQEEVQKVVTNFESDEIYSLETVDGMARKFGSYDYLFGDFKKYKDFLKDIGALEPKDILRVARKYLKPNKTAVAAITPKGREGLEADLKQWQKSYRKVYTKAIATRKRSVKPVKSKKLKVKWPKSEDKPSFESIALKTGPHLLMRACKDVPVINLRCAFRAGVRSESQNKEGLTELFSRVWCTSTSTRNEKEINLLTDRVAAHVSPFGGRNTVGLSMTCLEAAADDILDLYFDLLKNPVFDEEIIDREREIMIDQIKQRADKPDHVCMHQFLETMFKDHPYGRDPMGDEESLKKLRSSDLMGYYDKFYRGKNLTFSLSGYVGQRHIKDRLERETKGISKQKLEESFHKFSPPEGPVLVETKMDKEQTHILVGYPGLNFLDEDRHVLQLIQSLLAGQGGRLFMELRDKASLAYSVSPIRMDGVDAGYFGGYIACSTEKRDTAIEMLKSEFQKLMDTKVSESEVSKAKRHLIGRHDIELQRNSSIAASVLFDYIYGVDPEETFHFPEKITAVTAEDIQRVSQRIFSQPEVVSVVGRME